MSDSQSANRQPNAIEMRGIVKRFPGVIANNGINLSVARGEIHGLLGENGAGKSTLMNILFGLYHPDEGEILVNGQRVQFHNARDAVLAGLAMVHQHFMLIPRFTVTENVILGSEGANMVLDRKEAGKRVAEIGAQYGLNVDPDAIVGTLPVGMQQRVEILRALYQGGSTLILDEPTALLTPQEVEELYAVLNRLRAAGSTIIFITHKLREIAAVTDRVTVIHRGKTVGTRETAQTTAAERLGNGGVLPDAALAEGRTWTGTISTSQGDIAVELDGAAAPQAVANFVTLAQEGYFDGTDCHRLTTSGIYVLQCGDPTGTGTGSPGYAFGPIENAPADDVYPAGTIAMARQGGNGESMGSQFFLVYEDSTIPADDAGGYTVFGRITSGLDVVQAVADAGVSGGATDGAPATHVTIEGVETQ